MHSPGFQDTKLKLHRYVKYSQVQVVGRLMILLYPGGVKYEGLITQKRKFNVHSHSFQDTQLETSQVGTSTTLRDRLTILPYPKRGQG